MEFPNFRAVLFVTLYLFALGSASELNEVKESAIQTLDFHFNNIEELAKESSDVIVKDDDKTKAIIKHVKEFAEGIFKNSNFEINMAAVRNNLRANLSRSSSEVYKCVEKLQKQALTDINKFYTDKFSKIGYSAKELRKQVQNWVEDYHKAKNQYSTAYENSVAEIQEATSESDISSVVMNFEKATEQVAYVINDYLNVYADPVELLKSMDKLLKEFIVFTTNVTDKTVTAMEKCFPDPFP